jgi:hypothetical protein
MESDPSGGTKNAFLMKSDPSGRTKNAFLMKSDPSGGTKNAFLMKYYLNLLAKKTIVTKEHNVPTK